MAASFFKTFLFVLFALIVVSLAVEEEREKKQVAGLGLPGLGYYGGYGRPAILPYAAGVAYPGLGYVGHPGLGYPGFRAYGVGYPGYVGHQGYYGGYPYYGAYPY